MTRPKTIHRGFAVLAVVTLVVLSHSELSLAQSDKTIDRRVRSESGNFVVGFAASKRVDGDTGHAFLIWFSEDEQRRRSVQRAVGFYPTGGSLAKLVFQLADGKVYDDSQSKRDLLLLVKVNRDQFESSQEIAAEWEKGGKSYGIVFNDCVTFVERVATGIGLSVGNRAVNVYPEDFVASLIRENN